jgi:hypothetical protein
MSADKSIQLQEKLGRPLSAEQRASISHLNDVSVDLVAEAKRLNDPDLAEALIAYYLTPGHRRFIGPYVQDVVVGTTPPQRWRRGGVLVPDFNLGDQLTLDQRDLLAPIGNQFDVRITPRLADWIAGVSWVGSPARPQPDADYLTPLSPRTVSILDPPLEPVTDKTVAIRRWTASRLAAVLQSVGQLDSIGELSTMDVNLPPYERWLPDGRAALEALRRERGTLAREATGIPGFQGPDDWYRGT